MSRRVETPTNTMALVALTYAWTHRWRLFPVHAIDAVSGWCSCGHPTCDDRGKHPRIKDWPKDATTDPATIEKWWQKWPDANIALATGAGSGVVGFDVDPRHNGEKSLAALVAEHGELPPTVESKTGGDGRHVLFAHPGGEPLGGKVSMEPGLDVKTDGGYIILPPSLHTSGKRYEWKPGHAPGEIDLAPLPEWLLERLKSKTPVRAEAVDIRDQRGQIDPAKVLQGVPEGGRDDALFRYASRLRKLNYARSEAEVLVLKAAESCQPPFSDTDALKKLEQAWKYPAGDGPLLMERDYGHARELAERFRGQILWIEETKHWFEWRGQAWRPVPEELLLKPTSEALMVAYSERLPSATPDEQKRLAQKLKEVCLQSRMTAALGFLISMDGMHADLREFDRDPWLFNIQNGTLDLRKLTLRPHDPNDRLTKLANVSYDPAARSERWERFLARILLDPEVRRYLQCQLGRAMVGAVLEERLNIWWGTGANGKTTLARVLMGLFGDYARRAAPNLLVAGPYDRHPTEVADLVSSRLVFSVEVDQGKRLAEALIKDLTGGDRKKARFMRGDFFEFPQTFDIVLILNHRPIIVGSDTGIWRRVRLVPFTVQIPEAERRPQDELVEQLLGEGPAILNWLLDGLQDYQSDRMWAPQAVVAATMAYRGEMDQAGGFLTDCCETGRTYAVPAATLYEAYADWCRGAGEEVVAKQAFGRSLRERGFESDRRGDSRVRIWRGLRLRTPHTNTPD